MINWIKNLFDSKETKEVTEWKTEDSILQFLRSHLDEKGGLNDAAADLPDEVRDEEDQKLRFAPGLMDAMFGADDSDDAQARVNELAKLLERIAHYGDKRSAAEFYRLVTTNEQVIGIIDTFLESIVQKSLPIEPHILSFSKDLAFRTPHRNSVKFGVAILGLCGDRSVIEEIKILGLHDEFTVFATVALTNLSENLVQDLWALARKVDGWGKIQLVDRLATMELPEEVRDWLVREGYKNSIMYEYLAYTCAVHGKLHGRLEQESIDHALFRSAGEIIDALIMGGPAEDISVYVYAPVTVEHYLRHAKEHSGEVADFLTLHRLRDFLLELQTDLSEHQKNGWTQDGISNCLIDIAGILNTKDWHALTREALHSTDNQTYWDGKVAAQKLGIDIWDIVWDRLQKNPAESSRWYDVTHAAGADKVDQVVAFAVESLPLNELATGPRDVLGLGPKYIRHQSLDYVITFLEAYPRKGEPVILAGLNSPVTRNRNMALKVLESWKRENWSPDILQQLQQLRTIEPNSDTRANIERLLQGEALKWG